MAKNARLKRRACKGKRKFAAQQDAQAAIASLARHQQRRGVPIVSFLRAYRCQFCSAWHFGSSRAIDWNRVAATGS